MSVELIASRCRKLGLACDTFPTDESSSVLSALTCFPMYMVAHVDAWTSDTEFRIPILDLPGAEQIRESFALGAAEANLELEKDHEDVVRSLLAHARPSDLVIYEYALETLRLAMLVLRADLVEHTRVAIAESVTAVARASGEGVGGSGPKISPQEQTCIDMIDLELGLSKSQKAAAVLKELSLEPMSLRSKDLGDV